MKEKSEVCRCLGCGRKFSRAEHEACDGFCQECYELEIAEIDFEYE